jgi:hypothetical protein
MAISSPIVRSARGGGPPDAKRRSGLLPSTHRAFADDPEGHESGIQCPAQLSVGVFSNFSTVKISSVPFARCSFNPSCSSIAAVSAGPKSSGAPAAPSPPCERHLRTPTRPRPNQREVVFPHEARSVNHRPPEFPAQHPRQRLHAFPHRFPLHTPAARDHDGNTLREFRESVLTRPQRTVALRDLHAGRAASPRSASARSSLPPTRTPTRRPSSRCTFAAGSAPRGVPGSSAGTAASSRRRAQAGPAPRDLRPGPALASHCHRMRIGRRRRLYGRDLESGRLRVERGSGYEFEQENGSPSLNRSTHSDVDSATVVPFTSRMLGPPASDRRKLRPPAVHRGQACTRRNTRTQTKT